MSIFSNSNLIDRRNQISYTQNEKESLRVKKRNIQRILLVV